jgi:NAD(P)-dependent dehydrogenase (short-subunit alcohol dehydrogenase family)
MSLEISLRFALRAVDATRRSGLQWPKPCASATLQCNVDRPAASRLTILPAILSSSFLQAKTSNPMDLHLRGKRVLITGASKGIGAAAAEAFAEEGCHLRLAARSGDQLKALADRLRSAHQIDASAHVTDLRKPEDIARLVKDASDIDILVNNAGDIPGGSIDKIDEATWRHAWELKVFGYINLTRAIYAQMKARGGGVIVNDIGAAGEKFDANYICGSAGNAALMAFTRALGGKSLADNIRVVGINPGPVGTDRHVTLLKTRAKNQFGDENRYKEFQKGLPLGRPAHAREIGDLMAFLASDRSGYTSGVIFTVDGGIAAGFG